MTKIQISDKELNRSIELFIVSIQTGPFRILKQDPNRTSEYLCSHNNNNSIQKLAVNQAWQDVCRTVSNGDSDCCIRNAFAKKIEKQFDKGHFDIDELLSSETKPALTTGQKQKLINMTFKYLFCCKDIREKYYEEFKNCHMPLDSITLEWFKRIVVKENQIDDFIIGKIHPWSKLKSSESDEDADGFYSYEFYRDNISQYSTQKTNSFPLALEFFAWSETKLVLGMEAFIFAVNPDYTLKERAEVRNKSLNDKLRSINQFQTSNKHYWF